MASHASLRASDADREQTVERLRCAAAEGRLLADELEQRIGRALGARTYGELGALLADLPRPRPTRRSVRGLRPALALAIAIPVVLAVLGTAALVITGMLAALAAVAFAISGALVPFIVWIAAGWWLFGHRRGGYGVRRGRSWSGSCGAR